MKIFLTLSIYILSFTLFSQITITSIDLPKPGQNYLRSTATTANIDLTKTGANHVWDYTDLLRDTRDTMRYEAVNQTPIFYQFMFNSPLSPTYKATEAQRTADVNLGGFLDMTDNYLFSKNSSSQWTEVGIGTTISGAPLPTKYSDIKVKLDLPLNYGDNFSDPYSYLISIPTFGASGQDGVLSYTVDGWGILKTPGGSFEVLRVKTEIIKTDTVYLDLLSFGIRIPSNETIYEWYAQSEGYPILTVKEQLGQITTVEFTDDLTSSIKPNGFRPKITIYPNPVHSTLFLNINSPGIRVSIVNISGVPVFMAKEHSPTQIDVSNLPSGVYFLKLQNGGLITVQRFVKQ